MGPPVGSQKFMALPHSGPETRGALARTGWCQAASSSEPPNERGVGVPSSRSLSTASLEAINIDHPYDRRRLYRADPGTGRECGRHPSNGTSGTQTTDRPCGVRPPARGSSMPPTRQIGSPANSRQVEEPATLRSVAGLVCQPALVEALMRSDRRCARRPRRRPLSKFVPARGPADRAGEVRWPR